ncbi:hypothetical protein ACIRO3_29780 [Streptomyces sp. NPDC102278]|uniref:hypothetical protein n=1 Tax=Streptomyces sp. NPDC102278 TaxID=3366152 RepID=UPI00381B3BB7
MKIQYAPVFGACLEYRDEYRGEYWIRGFEPGHDKIIGAVHSELNMYTCNAQEALKIWGWDPKALTDVERYRIDQLLRMFVAQENQITAAFRRLNIEFTRYLDSDEKVVQQASDFVKALPRLTKEAVEREKQKKPMTGEEIAAHFEWLVYEFDQDSVQGVMSWRHPDIARNIGSSASLAMGGRSFEGAHWRLKDCGYPREYIKDQRLYDLIDTALAIQAEFQLQCLLTDREFTRIIETRGAEFEWLKAEAARKAAAEESGGFWGLFGDILGIVSAVAGVLALIPVLTPLCGPIAVVTAIASLGAHTIDAAIKGDWDAATIAGLGADVFAALPGVGAVAKSLKAGKAITKTFGVGAKLGTKASVSVRRAGLTFLAETAGSGASDASKVFNYIGTKGAKVLGASEKAGQITGKVLQGSVNLSTQVPLVTEMATGADMTDGKSAATGTALTANYGQTIGSWGAVGSAAQKTGTVSLGLFAKVIGRR